MSRDDDFVPGCVFVLIIAIITLGIFSKYKAYEEAQKEELAKHRNKVLVDGISAKAMGAKPENNPYSGEDGQLWLKGYYQEAK